ncbi:hypothetical protein [Thalassoglobus sp.]|uniref:hypothetical protein n=1 Tax=Thalassoglobus sp. TaxID=2795869 RepID=UPI003AA9D893
MNDSGDSASAPNPKWLKGKGLGPQVKWSVGTDGALTALAYARESGDLFITDESNTITRIDRLGKIATLNRVHDSIFALAWSDDGRYGAAIAGEDNIVRFDRELKTVHSINLPDIGLGIAISPFGHHVAVSMSNGRNVFFNERKRRIAQFETIRPLSFLQFCASEPLVFGAAEHGLICCHNLSGAEIWQEKNWSNVGGIQITGDGDLVYLASFGHGIEAYDGDGASIGSYVLDGTVNHIAVSYEPQRLLAGTVERNLIWLDADGELLWATTVEDEIVDLICDPLGEWAIVGFQSQGVYRLDWGGV